MPTVEKIAAATRSRSHPPAKPYRNTRKESAGPTDPTTSSTSHPSSSSAMAGSGSGSQSPSEPLKPCDRCHRSGVKCSPGPNPGVCGPCAAFGSECTYDRPVKRRGPVPRALSHKAHSPTGSSSKSESSWKYEAVASSEVIEELTDTFHRIVFPILPYFHWPTYAANVAARLYMVDRAFYCVTMAVCAIASARVRDGAGVMAESELSPTLPPGAPVSEVFYEAALRGFPPDLSQAPELDYKRAKIILAMLCIQYGQVRQLTTQLGDYMTLCANDGFHNESRWPPGLSEIEIQERRRLFWGAYTVELYSATTWGMTVIHREAQSTVLYPAEVIDDDEITETGIVPRPNPDGRPSYLVGWNFTTDLYRILEHALDQRRQRKLDPSDPMSRVTIMYSSRAGPTPQESLDFVAQLYSELPADFKGAKAMTGNIVEDRYGFQAADIIVTMQTVKMVMTGLEDFTVEKRCEIAGELLDSLATIPTAYIQAISSPILHHLAGVGHLLGSVIQSPLSYWCYLQVRIVLMAMADLLSSLESTLSFVPGIADKLRDHVLRIDQYMTTAALDRGRRTQVFHNAIPPAAWGSNSIGTAEAVAAVGSAAMATPTGGGGGGGGGVAASIAAIAESAARAMSGSPVSPSTSTGMWPTPPTPLFPKANEFAGPGAQAGSLDLLNLPVPMDGHFTLPNDILVDWPFDMNDAFDFLGNGT